MWTLLLLLVGGALSTCARAQGVTSSDRTILQYLQDEGYNELIELVRAAGMVDALSQEDALPLTLFAPPDSAFQSMPADIRLSLLTNGTFLRLFLNGHLMDEQLLTLFIRNGQEKDDLNLNKLTFNVYPNGVKTVNGATITDGDMLLKNGIVHPINKVLFPFQENIALYLAEHESDFKDLFGFLVLAHLFGDLSGPGPFTIFAPNDAAFARVQDQLMALVTSGDIDTLAAVLKNHVVRGDYWSAGIANGMTLDTLNNGTQLSVSVTGPLVTLNGKAHVIQPDVGATNGVIHTIDTVLLP